MRVSSKVAVKELTLEGQRAHRSVQRGRICALKGQRPAVMVRASTPVTNRDEGGISGPLEALALKP